MSDNWIKALGMGAGGRPLPNDWQSARAGLFRHALTFSQRPGLATGDRVVLYATGTGLFFAVGTVTSDPYRDQEDTSGAWPWRINVKLDRWRDFVHQGEPLDALNAEDRDLRKAIMRRSHIRLSDAEFEAAVKALSQIVPGKAEADAGRVHAPLPMVFA